MYHSFIYEKRQRKQFIVPLPISFPTTWLARVRERKRFPLSTFFKTSLSLVIHQTLPRLHPFSNLTQ